MFRSLHMKLVLIMVLLMGSCRLLPGVTGENPTAIASLMKEQNGEFEVCFVLNA